MKAKYETLDDYLDALDAIKARVAEETEGLNAKQVKHHFSRAAHALREATGIPLRVRHNDRKAPSRTRRS
jgi:hypothetical protein